MKRAEFWQVKSKTTGAYLAEYRFMVGDPAEAKVFIDYGAAVDARNAALGYDGVIVKVSIYGRNR